MDLASGNFVQPPESVLCSADCLKTTSFLEVTAEGDTLEFIGVLSEEGSTAQDLVLKHLLIVDFSGAQCSKCLKPTLV